MNLQVQTPYQHKIPWNDVGSKFSENEEKNRSQLIWLFIDHNSKYSFTPEELHCTDIWFTVRNKEGDGISQKFLVDGFDEFISLFVLW